MRIKLTDELIRTGLRCPPGKKRIEFVDISDAIGLYIEVRATSQGLGTYYLRYKDSSGKTCHQKLGRTNEIDLAEARHRAKTLKAQIQLGANPSEDSKAKNAVPTYEEFFYRDYLPYARPRKKTWAKDKELFELRLKKAFGPKRLNEIRRQQIQIFHTGLLDEGLAAASANHYVKLLRRTLNLAVEWEMLEKNSAQGIKMFTEFNNLEHFLEKDELARLLTVLNTDANRTVCRILLFLLSTGARLNEALQATWPMVDRSNRVWRIPAKNSKSGRVRSVPLNDSAIAVLDQLDRQGSEFLFTNPRTGNPYTTIHKVWDRLRYSAGLPHLRIHDLRHQFASFLVNSGRSLYEVQQILGHSDPSVTQRYSHLSTRALQDASSTASDIIAGAMRGSG